MNKTIIILAALLPLFITSCTNDDANVTTTPQQDKVVTLSAGITRAEGAQSGSGFNSGDKVKITNVTRAEKGLPYSQAVFTMQIGTTATTWTSEGTLLWCAGEENTFRAVYPATAEYSSFTVPADQSDADKLASADWMTGEAKATLNNLTNASPLDIKLTRKMAMVVVVITGNVEVSTLTSLTVEYLSYDGTDITYENNNEHKIQACKDNEKFSAIIAPGSKSSGTILCNLTISGSDEKRLKLQSNIEFLAGRKYTFQYNMPSPSSGAATRSVAPDNLTLVSVEPM